MEPAVSSVTGSKARKGQSLGVVLGKHGGKRQKGEQVDNIKLKGGTQSAYLAARLRRDQLEDMRRSWSRWAAYRPEFSSVAPVGVGSRRTDLCQKSDKSRRARAAWGADRSKCLLE